MIENLLHHVDDVINKELRTNDSFKDENIRWAASIQSIPSPIDDNLLPALVLYFEKVVPDGDSVYISPILAPSPLPDETIIEETRKAVSRILAKAEEVALDKESGDS